MTVRTFVLFGAALTLAACTRRPAAEAAPSVQPAGVATASSEAMGQWTGRLVVSMPTSSAGADGRTVFTLETGKGSAVELQIPEQLLRDAGGVAVVSGKRVTITGVEQISPRLVRVRTLVLTD